MLHTSDNNTPQTKDKKMNGHWMIKRVETILGTPVRSEGQWRGNFGSKEEATKAAKQELSNSPIASQVAVKFKIAYMK
jgi:hypothetical protein